MSAQGALAIASDLTSFALRLADVAREETLGRWSSGCAVEDKSASGEFDPVTEADTQAELAMRSLIEREHPDHGVRGEELPERPSTGPHCWSLDPIDGTRSFTCGLPTWVTLIALLENGAPVIGLIDAPCLGERYIGAGGTSWLEARGASQALQTSDCASLAQARLSTTDPYLFTGAAAQSFAELRSKVRTTRYGHDGYAYARLAAGTLDLVVECGLKPHDYDALIPVIRGAGGVFGDWTGGTDFSAGQVIAAATPQLYEQAVAIMKASERAGGGP